jgi:hypothetical protein
MTTTKTDAQTVLEALECYALSHKAVGNLGTGVVESIFNGERAMQALPAAQRLVGGEKGNMKTDDPFSDFCYQCDQ